jgi:hypothetical protein
MEKRKETDVETDVLSPRKDEPSSFSSVSCKEDSTAALQGGTVPVDDLSSPLDRESFSFKEKSQSPEFDEFWKAYPKKVAKQDALRAWKKLKPSDSVFRALMSSLERQKNSAEWAKDGGKYIPYPATWLNGRRWEDVEYTFHALPKPKEPNMLDVIRAGRKETEENRKKEEEPFRMKEKRNGGSTYEHTTTA